jgi:hypothetical protein
MLCSRDEPDTFCFLLQDSKQICKYQNQLEIAITKPGRKKNTNHERAEYCNSQPELTPEPD